MKAVTCIASMAWPSTEGLSLKIALFLKALKPELSDDEPIEEFEESKKAFSFGFWCLRNHATMALAIVRKWLTVNFGIDHHRR